MAGSFGKDGKLANPLNAKLFDPPNKYDMGTLGRFAAFPGRYALGKPNIGGKFVDGGMLSTPYWDPGHFKFGRKMSGFCG